MEGNNIWEAAQNQAQKKPSLHLNLKETAHTACGVYVMYARSVTASAIM